MVMKNFQEKVYYISGRETTASEKLAHFLRLCISRVEHPWNELVFLCIGSDRVTGDSLGPLIGHQLCRQGFCSHPVYGTLSHPVHALNLTDCVSHIKKRHPGGLIIAIDASLGSKRHLGFITVGNGSIRPGAGVKKSLPEVGDVFITGIVNLSGTFEHLLLQTTRLSTIVTMADSITGGILQACPDYLRTVPQVLTLPENLPCSAKNNPQGIANTHALVALSSEVKKRTAAKI